MKTIRVTRTERYSTLVDVEGSEDIRSLMDQAQSRIFDVYMYLDDRYWEVEIVEEEKV